jgi:hypothetical protein
VHDLQGDLSRDVEMLGVFVLQLRRLVLASFVESKELESRKWFACGVPKLTKLSSPVLMHVHHNPCNEGKCIIGRGHYIKHVPPRICPTCCSVRSGTNACESARFL